MKLIFLIKFQMYFVFQLTFLLINYSHSVFAGTLAVQTSELNAGDDLYLNGNYTEAIKKWSILAKQGVEAAQFKLGAIYRFGGNGINKNINEAIKWYTLAAENGNEYAQYNLGKIYESEKNIVNYELAAKWYLLGAQKGNAFSQLKLGTFYIEGKGISRNLTYAHMWLNLSGAQGNYRAIKKRILLQQKLSISELKKARLLAKDCLQKNYKNCQ
jgi:TPR repeat protein